MLVDCNNFMNLDMMNTLQHRSLARLCVPICHLGKRRKQAPPVIGLLAIMLLAALMPAPDAQAVQRIWNNTSTDFNADASWGGAIMNNVGAFTTAPIMQPNVTASISIAGVYFNAVSGYDLTSTGRFSLTLTGQATTPGSGSGETSASNSAAIAATNTTGTNTIDADLILLPASGNIISTFYQAAGGTLVVNGAISGSGIALEINGGTPGGTIQLTNPNNSYTGNTIITGVTTASVSNIGDAGANGNLGGGTTINLGGGSGSGTLLYTGSGETTSKIINLAGTTGGATIDQSGTGLLLFSGTNTATGAGDKTLTLQGSMAGKGEIGGAIVDNTATNKTSVFKNGTGTWTLSGANTYTGATTIGTSAAGAALVTSATANGGVLSAAAAGALGGGLATGTASVTVHNGGTLLLSGSGNLDRIRDAAPITLGTNNATSGSVGGTIQKDTGASEGTGARRTNASTVTGTNTTGLGALTLASNSIIDYGTGVVGTLTFAGYDPTNGTSANLADDFVLNILNYTTSASGQNLNVSGMDGTDDRLIFKQNLATAGYLDNITFNGAGASQIDLGGGYFEVVPVPEPATVLGGLLMVGALGWSQRRRIGNRLTIIQAR
jgi:autotransporter-associated beta strand protein